MTPFLPIQISLGEPPSVDKYPPGVFRTRSYIDPVMMALQGGVSTSNFQVVKLASFGRNNAPFFNDIAKFQTVNYDMLRSYQFAEDKPYGTISHKMNWLCNHDLSGTPSRPYWINEGKLQFGTILFGQQLVRVQTDENGKPVEYVRFGAYPTTTTEEWITFFRVVGIRKHEIGIITHRSHPWLVQQCTAIEGGKETDKPRGVIHYHPVWSDIDWPTNYGDGRLYVARDFLVSA